MSSSPLIAVEARTAYCPEPDHSQASGVPPALVASNVQVSVPRQPPMPRLSGRSRGSGLPLNTALARHANESLPLIGSTDQLPPVASSKVPRQRYGTTSRFEMAAGA